MPLILPESIHSFIISLLFSSRTTSRNFEVVPYSGKFRKKCYFSTIDRENKIILIRKATIY